MEKFSQLNERPLFNTVKVESGAEAAEYKAERYGKLSDTLLKASASLANEASSALYIQNQSEADHIVEKSKLEMLQNPVKSAEIAKNADELLKGISRNAILNGKHRGQLNSSIKESSAKLNEEAVKATTNLAKGQANISFYDTLPDVMHDYSEALISDPKRAEALKENIIEQTRGMLATGVISKAEARSVINTMSHQIEKVRELHEAWNVPAEELDVSKVATLRNPDFVKKGIKAGVLSLGGEIKPDLGNPNTAVMADHILNDQTTEGAISYLRNGGRADSRFMQKVFKLPPQSQKKVAAYYHGSNSAQVAINRNEPITNLMAELSLLKEKGAHLDHYDSAKRDVLQAYVDDITKNNRQVKRLNETIDGQVITNEWRQKNAAIESHPNLQGDENKAEREQRQLDNYNDLIHQRAATMKAQQMPWQYINPIEPETLNVLGNVLTHAGQDVNPAIAIIKQHDDVSRGYLAKGQKTVAAQEVVMASALNLNSKSPTAEFMTAKVMRYNQKGINYTGLKFPKDKVESYAATLKASEAGRYVGRLPEGTPDTGGIWRPGIDRSGALVEMAVNYAKGEALVNEDFEMNNFKEYIDDFQKNFINKGYDIHQDTHFSFNRNEIPFADELSPTIAAYMLGRANEKRHAVMSAAQFSASQDDPLVVTMTRDRHLVVMDSQQNVIDELAWDTKIIDAAKVYAREHQEQFYKNAKKATKNAPYFAQVLDKISPIMAVVNKKIEAKSIGLDNE